MEIWDGLVKIIVMCTVVDNKVVTVLSTVDCANDFMKITLSREK